MLVELRWYSACMAPFLAEMNGFCLPRPKVLLGKEWFSGPTSRRCLFTVLGVSTGLLDCTTPIVAFVS